MIAQLSPIHSWKSIGPFVVSALKLGAMSLMRSDMISSVRSSVRFAERLLTDWRACFKAIETCRTAGRLRISGKGVPAGPRASGLPLLAIGQIALEIGHRGEFE